MDRAMVMHDCDLNARPSWALCAPRPVIEVGRAMPKILIPCREQICYLYFEVLAHYQTSFVMLIRYLVSHSQLFVILADTPGYSRFLSAPILESCTPRVTTISSPAVNAV